MTDEQKALEYYRTAAMQGHVEGRPTPIPPFVPCRVRLERRVRGDFPFGHQAAVGPGEMDCKANPLGAVSVVADNGQELGLRLHEFVPIAWAANPEAEKGGG
jgi:TPR repeat protein